MRYAILADIHGNLEALNAVMEAMASERIDRFLCLGDIVGYGANPAECLARLQGCEALMVGGNHDLACIGKLGLDWFTQTARRAIEWTRDQLSFTDLDALRRLPLTAHEELVTLVHGTLRHPERFEYLVDLAQAVETMLASATLMCLLGHTHVPCVIEYQRPTRRVTRMLTAPQELAEVTYHDDPEGWRYIVNPGSVGQPRDGDPRASVAVIDTERTHVMIRRIPYDIATAQRKIRDARLPELFADRLAVGR